MVLYMRRTVPCRSGEASGHESDSGWPDFGEMIGESLHQVYVADSRSSSARLRLLRRRSIARPSDRARVVFHADPPRSRFEWNVRGNFSRLPTDHAGNGRSVGVESGMAERVGDATPEARAQGRAPAMLALVVESLHSFAAGRARRRDGVRAWGTRRASAAIGARSGRSFETSRSRAAAAVDNAVVTRLREVDRQRTRFSRPWRRAAHRSRRCAAVERVAVSPSHSQTDRTRR